MRGMCLYRCPGLYTSSSHTSCSNIRKLRQLQAHGAGLLIFSPWLTLVFYDLDKSNISCICQDGLHVTDLSVCNHDVFEAPASCGTLFHVTPVADLYWEPSASDALRVWLPLHLAQRAAAYPHGEVPVPQQRVVQRDDGRGVAHQEYPPVGVIEAPLEFRHEGLEEASRPVVALSNFLAPL